MSANELIRREMELRSEKLDASYSGSEDAEFVQIESGSHDEHIKNTENVIIDEQLMPQKAHFFDYFSVSFNFINCCIGAGLLSLGKIMATTGMVPFCIYMALSVLFCTFVFRQISMANYYGNFSNLSDAMRCLYGKVWAYLTDISILMINLGFLIAYVSVSADYVRTGIAALAEKPDEEGNYDLDSMMWKNLFKLFATVIFMVPLSLLRSVNAINYISSFAIIFVLIAVIGVIIRYVQYKNTGFLILYPNKPHPKPDAPIIPLDTNGIIATIAYFTTFFTIYSTHASMSPVEKQISGPPGKRLNIITVSYLICIVVCCIIYCLVPFLAVAIFDRKCSPEELLNGCLEMDSNILLNFGKEDTMMTIIKLLYAIVVLVSYPCMLFPMRECVMNWFGIDKNKKVGYLWFVLIGLVITAFCCVVSILIPQIDQVFSIVANIFGIVLVELIGLMLWYKMPLLKAHPLGTILDQVIELSETDSSNPVIRKFQEEITDGNEDFVGGLGNLENVTGILEDPSIGSISRRGGKRKGFAKAKGDKYQLEDLRTEEFKPSLLRSVIFYGGSAIFVCFNITAIVCDFVKK